MTFIISVFWSYFSRISTIELMEDFKRMITKTDCKRTIELNENDISELIHAFDNARANGHDIAFLFKEIFQDFQGYGCNNLIMTIESNNGAELI